MGGTTGTDGGFQVHHLEATVDYRPFTIQKGDDDRGQFFFGQTQLTTGGYTVDPPGPPTTPDFPRLSIIGSQNGDANHMDGLYVSVHADSSGGGSAFPMYVEVQSDGGGGSVANRIARWRNKERSTQLDFLVEVNTGPFIIRSIQSTATVLEEMALEFNPNLHLRVPLATAEANISIDDQATPANRLDCAVSTLNYLGSFNTNTTKAEGGIRFGGGAADEYYILGCDSDPATATPLLKLYDIVSNVANNEVQRISAASIQGSGSGTVGFLGSDNTTTNSGLAYTFTNAAPLVFTDTTPDITFGTGTGVQQLVFIGTGTGTNDALIRLRNSDGSTRTLTLAADSTTTQMTSDGPFTFNSGANSILFNSTISYTFSSGSNVRLAANNQQITLGAGDDDTIEHDGTDLLITPTNNLLIAGGTVIDDTSTEALLIRKDSDGGDVFTVDTSADLVTSNVDFTVTSGNRASIGTTIVSTTTLGVAETFTQSGATQTIGLQLLPTITAGASKSGESIGLAGTMALNNAATYTGDVSSIKFIGSITGAATITDWANMRSVFVTTAGTFTTISHYRAEKAAVFLGSATTGYGYFHEGWSANVTNKWAFYATADPSFFGDKIAFTQTDKNEYIDSLTDGELDIEGTTSVNLRINGNEVIAVDAAIVSVVQDIDFAEGQSVDVETVTTTSATLGDDDYVVLCDDATAGGQITLTLPAAASHTGRVYFMKKLGATANIVVDGNASETIDGNLTHTLSAQFEGISIVCDGSNWHII